MRAERPSLTAAWVAALRGIYTDVPRPLRAAPDDVAFDLLPGHLALPARVLRRFNRSPRLHAALELFSHGLAANVVLRTLRLDDAIREAVASGARQLVLVGAGFDARAYRLAGLGEVTVFEVDHPSTQRAKRARLAGREALAASVVFVPVDFERQSMADELRGAGFAPAAPSVWVWEGVTMYLTAGARRATIRTLGELSAPGSAVLLTYLPARERRSVIESMAELGAMAIGERLRGRVTPAMLVGELEAAGFAPVEDSDGPAWAARYWTEPGAPRVASWEHILVARRQG